MSLPPTSATISTCNAQSVGSGHVMPPPLRPPISVNKIVPRTPPVSIPQTTSSVQSVPSSSHTSVQGNQPYTRPGLSTPQQALDMFYLALCEPAFPQPNEAPLTPYPANFCYDVYMRMINGQSLV
uniref:UMA domain-containing protein n=1 Tax=Heterorhabditis bacteriophora TaxID=37862 RepID=A0A1I7WQU7_HETBA